jgi:hypothetical protein
MFTNNSFSVLIIITILIIKKISGRNFSISLQKDIPLEKHPSLFDVHIS